MERTIRLQMYRILVAYVLLGLIVVWQHHFILAGIRSNPYLNLIIIAVFLFGSLQGLRFLFNLASERVAFVALQSMYSDVAEDRAGRAGRDPLDRYSRCFRPGIVFRSPRLLGHVFDLTIEELMRTNGMRISVTTMHDLLAAVDSRINAERSLLVYLTSLSVFLGLIGTFIGLMEMVGSVGGIIGGLAQSDAASADTIKQLIKNLEAPLTGMAQGFSSSLFGLFGSLVLGLVSRFCSQAANSVRGEFEGWLAGIAQIETARSAEGEETGYPVAQFQGLAVSVMTGLRRSAGALKQASDRIRDLTDRQGEQTRLLGETSAQLERLAAEQVAIRGTLGRLEELRGELDRGRREAAGHAERLGAALGSTAEQLRADLSERAGTLAGQVAAMQDMQAAASGRAEELAEVSRGDSAALLSALRQAEAGTREKIADVAGAVARLDEAVEANRRDQSERLQVLDAGMGQVLDSLAVGERRADERQASLAGAVDRVGGMLTTAAAGLGSQLDGLGSKVDAGGAAVAAAREVIGALARASETRLDGLAGLVELADQNAEGRGRVTEAGLQRLSAEVYSEHRLGREALDALSARVREAAQSVDAAQEALRQEGARTARDASDRNRDLHQMLERMAQRDAMFAETLRAVSAEARASQDNFVQAMRDSLQAGFSELAAGLRQGQATLADAIERLAREQAAIAAKVSDLAASRTVAEELEDVSRSIEEGLARGFADFNRNFEALFVSHSELVRAPAPAEAGTPAPVLADDETMAIPLDRLRHLALGARGKRANA